VGLSLLRQAYADGSNDPRIQYHYAIALRDTGSKEDAIKHLKAVAAARGEFTEKTEATKALEQLEKGS
jgi:alkylhydroperoxidase/carboxymuconolactone decarboxylase family protein YurZ